MMMVIMLLINKIKGLLGIVSSNSTTLDVEAQIAGHSVSQLKDLAIFCGGCFVWLLFCILDMKLYSISQEQCRS